MTFPATQADGVRRGLSRWQALAAGWVWMAGCGDLGYDPALEEDTTYGDPSKAPVIADLTFAPDPSKWMLDGTFAWDDPQRNVSNGFLHVEVNGRVLTEMPIPSDSLSLDAYSITFYIDFDDLEWGVEHLFEVQLVDADGNWSGAISASYTPLGTPVHEDEPNNSVGDAMDLGQVVLPLLVRGDLSTTGTYGDSDSYRFTPVAGGTLTSLVYWGPVQCNYDFEITDAGGAVVISGKSASASPEQAQGHLTTGQTYVLTISGSGPAALYTAVLSF